MDKNLSMDMTGQPTLLTETPYSVASEAITEASTMGREGYYLNELEYLATAAAAIQEATQNAATMAKKAGETWASIGGALSVTRQAAQQRYGA